MKIRIGLIATLMLLGTPAGADSDALAAALASSEAAAGAFSQMLSGSTVEAGFPSMADPAVAAILNAAWNLDALKIENPVEAKDLQVLDKICLNGMIIWKSYVFDRLDGLEDLETKALKRVVRYQAEIGPGMAFSIRCGAAFIEAYKAAAPEAIVDQSGAYQLWIDKEKGWIISSFGVVCTGIFAADNSRPLSDALQAVLPQLAAPNRQILDRDALRNSVQAAVAKAPIMPGVRGSKNCHDLEMLLAPG